MANLPARQRTFARYGIPVGLVMLVAFGPMGWFWDSTFFGLLAGMGLMLVILSYRFLSRGGR